jgi:hypothetical protein
MSKLLELALLSQLTTAEFLLLRYPRLIRAMSWVAILSKNEASYALRDYLLARDQAAAHADLMRWGGGEAVCHFGGPLYVTRERLFFRHSVARIVDRCHQSRGGIEM